MEKADSILAGATQLVLSKGKQKRRHAGDRQTNHVIANAQGLKWAHPKRAHSTPHIKKMATDMETQWLWRWKEKWELHRWCCQPTTSCVEMQMLRGQCYQPAVSSRSVMGWTERPTSKPYISLVRQILRYTQLTCSSCACFTELKRSSLRIKGNCTAWFLLFRRENAAGPYLFDNQMQQQKELQGISRKWKKGVEQRTSYRSYIAVGYIQLLKTKPFKNCFNRMCNSDWEKRGTQLHTSEEGSHFWPVDLMLIRAGMATSTPSKKIIFSWGGLTWSGWQDPSQNMCSDCLISRHTVCCT